MITVTEAFGLVMSTARGFGKERVLVEEAAGRILREEVRADRDLPPFHRVCMDGIAIDSAVYLQGTRKFYSQGLLAAGQAPGLAVGPDACMEVMTGAVLPPGTDSVIPYEQLEELRERDGTWFGVKTFGVPGQHVQTRGSDAPRGRVLLEEGVRITSAVIAVLTSAGISELKVSRLPRISIICSGDELVPVSASPLPHQIRQSNGYAISALLQNWGISSRIYHVRDHQKEIRVLLRRLSESPDDCIISTGGVSAGRRDFIPELFRETGGEVIFHKVAQRPGKPLLFGTWEGGKVFFGLPGNPVSALAGCCRYVLPWILQNIKGVMAPVYAGLNEVYSFSPSLTCFLPVRIACNTQGRLTAYILKGQGSGDLISMRQANGFIELPADGQLFGPGEDTAYRVWPLELILP